MELFQIAKKYIRQPVLYFQKCFERNQNIRAQCRGSHNMTGGRDSGKSNSLINKLIF